MLKNLNVQEISGLAHLHRETLLQIEMQINKEKSDSEYEANLMKKCKWPYYWKALFNYWFIQLNSDIGFTL